MIRKCREQYEYLLRKQNNEAGEGQHYTELTFDSMRALLHETTGPQEAHRITKKLDTNFDARISFEEFQAAMVASQAEQDDAVLRSSFKRLDVNGDTYITAEEIAQTLNASQDALHRVKKTQGFQQQLLSFIKENDSDKNKKLDENEFVEAMKRFAVND